MAGSREDDGEEERAVDDERMEAVDVGWCVLVR